jgi:hypothetical protein
MIKVLEYDYGKGKVSRARIREIVKSVVAEKRLSKKQTVTEPILKKQKRFG